MVVSEVRGLYVYNALPSYQELTCGRSTENLEPLLLIVPLEVCPLAVKVNPAAKPFEEEMTEAAFCATCLAVNWAKAS